MVDRREGGIDAQMPTTGGLRIPARRFRQPPRRPAHLWEFLRVERPAWPAPACRHLSCRFGCSIGLISGRLQSPHLGESRSGLSAALFRSLLCFVLGVVVRTGHPCPYFWVDINRSMLRFVVVWPIVRPLAVREDSESRRQMAGVRRS